MVAPGIEGVHRERVREAVAESGVCVGEACGRPDRGAVAIHADGPRRIRRQRREVREMRIDQAQPEPEPAAGCVDFRRRTAVVGLVGDDQLVVEHARQEAAAGEHAAGVRRDGERKVAARAVVVRVRHADGEQPLEARDHRPATANWMVVSGWPIDRGSRSCSATSRTR